MAFILAPLAVLPERQKRWVGGALVREGLKQLRQRGHDLFFVYGDPGYYGRFGFAREGADRFAPKHTLSQPHGWQVMEDRRPRQHKEETKVVSLSCVPPLDRAEYW